MTLALADYEHRPARIANVVALVVGITMLMALLWVGFGIFAPTGWWNDRPFTADPAWIVSYWMGTFIDIISSGKNVIFGIDEARAASGATQAILGGFDLDRPILTRLAAACAGAWTSAMIVHSFILLQTPVRDTREHVEGLRLLQGKPAQRSASVSLARAAQNQGFGLRLAPKLMLSKLRELRGILIVGATGSGKTRLILYLLDSILGAMRSNPQRRIRLLVHDTTGEIADGIPLDRSEFAILHGHKPGGYCWAMGRDIVSIEDAESAGSAFAPETRESMWGDGSGTLIAGCLVLNQYRHGLNWGAEEFYDTLLTDPIVLRQALETLYPPAAQLIMIEPDTGGLSRTTVSFFLSFRAAVLRQMRPLAQNWVDGKPFSFIDWLEDRPGQPSVVIVQRSGKHSDLSAGWIGAIVDAIAAQASDEQFPNSQRRRIFLCLDELAALKRLRSLPDLLDVGRNKGVGVIAALQEVEQLRSIYGADMATSLLKRFRTKIVCQQNQDAATDELTRTLIGMRTVRIEQTSETTTKGKDGVSTSTARTKQEKEVPVVRGERLAYGLGVFDNKVRALIVGLGDIVQIDWPLTVWSKRHRTRK